MIDAIRSEWIKVSTIPVTWVLALSAVAFPLVVIVLTAIFSEDPPDGSELTELVTLPTVVSAMLLAVVSSLSITNEFSHGTIRPTFAAMPDRMRPLLAKPIVQVAIAFVVTAAIVVAGWIAGSAHRRRNPVARRRRCEGVARRCRRCSPSAWRCSGTGSGC